jgi:hypothetical protein
MIDETTPLNGITYSDNSVWTDSSISTVVFNPHIRYPHLKLRENHSSDSRTICIIYRKIVLILLKVYNSNWWFVKFGKLSGWIRISEYMRQQHVLETVDKFRQYEIWHGNNHFFCNGFIMTGIDIYYFL